MDRWLAATISGLFRYVFSPLKYLPKGRERKVVASTPLVQIAQPAEEWICAFCEYDLFYGDDAAYRKAVRNRKKVLRRRRRAAERAAAAASGGNTTAKTPPLPADEEYDECEGATWSGMNEHGNAPPQRNGRWKEAPDREPTTNGCIMTHGTLFGKCPFNF
jgi:hypothetical protein